MNKLTPINEKPFNEAEQAEEMANKFLNSVEKALAVPAVPQPLPIPALPIPVQRFCTEIDKNFTVTADALVETAKKLEHAAKELRQRAENLLNASPEVRKTVESWITYERESNERGKFLNTLFDK